MTRRHSFINKHDATTGSTGKIEMILKLIQKFNPCVNTCHRQSEVVLPAVMSDPQREVVKVMSVWNIHAGLYIWR